MNINNNDVHNKKKKKVNKNVLNFILFYFILFYFFRGFFFSSRLWTQNDATRQTQECLDFYMMIRHLNLLGARSFSSSVAAIQVRLKPV